MKKVLLFILVLFSFNLIGQNFWHSVNESTIISNRNIEHEIIPIHYVTNHLNISGLKEYLKDAPLQFNKKGKSIPVSIPMPDGSFMVFDVVYSPVMMSDLAKKYPKIRSFKGFSQNDSNINIRFNIGLRGFHASIFWKNNNIYIDPYSDDNNNYFISYYTKDYKVDISEFNLSCGRNTENFIDQDIDPINYNDEVLTFRNDEVCDSVKQYNYKLALSCTGEWAQRHGGTKELVIDDMVTAVNRINQIYENEFAIHLNLINNNEDVIWLDPETDPFKNPTIGALLLNENFNAVNNAIDIKSYDIGHIFTNSCSDVGGIASKPAVCIDGLKSRGVTCHYSNNFDYIITNVTAHEMGHQFSADHTFNNCRGNNESSFGYEPGAGTTIMSYCGLCGINNVDYQCLETFHAFSIEQIKYYSRIASDCAEIVSSSNTVPELSLEYENGFHIPISTPFVLKGNAYDCEGDDLLYSWEQMDSGPRAPYGSPIGNSPLFVTREMVETPIRYFPELRNILYNLNSTAEILPTEQRDLNFRLIVRDYHEGAGGTDWKDVSFKVDGNSGPFLVTYPNSTIGFNAGEAVEIKWDVANTDNDAVNCQKVNILLSMDIGYTYPYTLKYHTANDGSEIIYLPDTISKKARIKIEAANNIFFDVANYSIKIEEPLDTTFVFDLEDASGQICLPNSFETEIKTRGTNGYDDTIRFEILNLPLGTEYDIYPSQIKAGQSAKITFDFDAVKDNGYYDITVLGISSSGDTIIRSFAWEFYSNRYDELTIAHPIPGSIDHPQNPFFKWNKPKVADYVNIFISKNPSFPEDETMSKSFITDTFFTPAEILDYSTLYYWKLEFSNKCGLVTTDTIYTFSTFATDCKNYISENVPRTINSQGPATSTIDIDNDLVITDVDISMKGTHSRFKELRTSLISPNADTILLFGHQSFNYQGSFSLVFNDQAKNKIQQPPKGIFKPTKPLSVNIGKNGKGSWILEVTDNQYQQSGKLEFYSLNICSVVTLINPILVNNELFKIPLNAPWAIQTDLLKVTDANNSDDELIYTIIKEPQFSNLYRFSSPLIVGSTFTQKDLNQGNIKIEYTGNEEVKDNFYFTVNDGEGGWIDITSFNFETDFNIDPVEELFDEYVQIFPNPTNSTINIDIDKSGKYKLKIFNIAGEKILSKTISGLNTYSVDMSKFNSGIYIIKINNDKYNYVGKIIKQE